MLVSPILTQQPIPVPQPNVQSNFPPIRPIHVAIISDGNGRWATTRGLPRSAGHRAGAQAARAVIEAAPSLGIHALTLFALSSANWQRPTSASESPVTRSTTMSSSPTGAPKFHADREGQGCESSSV